MPYNKNLKLTIENGDVAGMSLDEIGKRLVESMNIFDLLAALSNGYEEKHSSLAAASDAAGRAWTEQIDLMHHFDAQSGPKPQDMPETNALSLIRRLWLENLIDTKEGAALKDRFNAHVHDALGTTLDEEQVQALYELLTGFDIGQELAEIRGVSSKSDLKPVKR